MTVIAAKRLSWKNALYPFLFCVALLLICCIPVITEAILSFDTWAFLKLNSLVASSPVFDRVIRAVASEDDRARLLIPVVIGLGVYLYTAPNRRDRYRRLASILFIIIVLVLTMILEKQIDLIVERRSPSFTHHPYENLKKIYGWSDFTLKEKHTFPSDEALFMLALGFTLLRLRSRGWAITAIILGLVSSLARCIAGTTWLSDIYLGGVPGAYLVSVIAVRTPFIRLRPWLEHSIISTVDQLRVIKRKARPIFQLRSWPLDLNQALHLDVAVKRYARRKLPVVLGHKQGREDLDINIEIPLHGMRSLVRRVTVNGEAVILRVYPTHRRFEAYRHRDAAEMLSSHGIRAPKIINFDNHRTGAIFMMEEFVDGRFLSGPTLTDDELDSVTDEYAHIHSIQNPSWGPVDMARLEDYHSAIIRRAKKQLRKIGHIQVLDKIGNLGNRQRQILDWLMAWKEVFKNLQNFSLVHNNLHRQNGIYMKDGRYCLLDNTTLEWGVPASDIALVHYSLCESDPAIVERFNSYYYPKLPAADREVIKALSPFYNVLLQLNYLSRSLGRIQTGKITDEESKARQLQRWNMIVQTTAGIPGAEIIGKSLTAPHTTR